MDKTTYDKIAALFEREHPGWKISGYDVDQKAEDRITIHANDSDTTLRFNPETLEYRIISQTFADGRTIAQSTDRKDQSNTTQSSAEKTRFVKAWNSLTHPGVGALPAVLVIIGLLIEVLALLMPFVTQQTPLMITGAILLAAGPIVASLRRLECYAAEKRNQ